jgi:hypothetical protein
LDRLPYLEFSNLYPQTNPPAHSASSPIQNKLSLWFPVIDSLDGLYNSNHPPAKPEALDFEPLKADL